MYANTIICGESAAELSKFPRASIDLAVADPPYLIDYRDRGGRMVRNDDNPDAVLPVYTELYRVLKPNTYCITFYGRGEIAAFANAWTDAGFRTIGHIVWPKSYASSAGHLRCRHEAAFVLAKAFPAFPERPISDVQHWEYSGNKHHPTEKSVAVIARLIKAFSKPGDLVLDPFSGSGSTAVAAAIHGRRYVGIELEAGYCELARKRLEARALLDASTPYGVLSRPGRRG